MILTYNYKKIVFRA